MSIDELKEYLEDLRRGSMELIYREIKKKAEEGDMYAIFYSSDLTSHQLKRLKEDGYDVDEIIGGKFCVSGW